MDEDTGQYNYGYRDYVPSSGRFATIDPIKDGSDWYVYCGNDPVNFVDQYGLWTNKQVGTVVMVIGGVGLFVGGNIPAALVMAAGAILYTTPDEDSTFTGQLTQMGEAYADMTIPVTGVEAVAESIKQITEPEQEEESVVHEESGQGTKQLASKKECR